MNKSSRAKNYLHEIAETKLGDLTRHCWSCEFWLSDIDWDKNPPEEMEQGKCRRFPVTVTKFEGDSCGEWRVNIKAAHEVRQSQIILALRSELAAEKAKK